MKIDNIKINAYGNLEDRDIKFTDRINIVYGLNESGKSTLLNCILSMFYGISNNKDGNSISDYDKYLPWSGREFSGRVNYTLNDGKRYEVFRDFNKKKPQIYNEKAEDISAEFEMDKKEGSKFFIEQTGIDKQMYLSTVVSAQQQVDLDEKNQNMLIQKIANLAGSGEDNVSYKKANEKLTSKIRDEVGTNKTSQKPINIVQTQISILNKKISEIEPYENKKYDIDVNRSNVLKKIESDKLLKEASVKIKNSIDDIKIFKSKVEIDKEKQKENDITLDEIYREKQNYEEQNNRIKKEINNLPKSKKNIIIIVLIISLALLILDWTIIRNRSIAGIISIGLISIVGIYYAVINNKNEQSKIDIDKKNTLINNNENQTAGINGKIDLLEKENEKLDTEIKNIEEKIKDELDTKKANIINEYRNMVDITKLKEVEMASDINRTIEEIDSRIRQENIELNKFELEENTIVPQLDDLINLKEEQANCNEELQELQYKEEVLNLAIDVLKEAYDEMKNTITPKFTKNLSENINIISNGKYKNVKINNENELLIEKPNGEFIKAEKLSIGTIDQLYLSLRLCMLDDISTEKLPIILDETFAYFDDKRLENVMRYLNEKAEEHQVIIFTCSQREKNTAEKLTIKYNLIEL